MIVMDAHAIEEAHRQAEICKVFGNATRVLILQVLGTGEMTVSTLAEALGTSLQNVSQHLRLMKDKSILVSRREGHSIYYSVNRPELMRNCRVLQQATKAPARTHK